MADRTSISWTDATWNPLAGCSRVSEGCRNCYAEGMAARFAKSGMWGEGLATMVRTPDGKAAPRWTGEVRFNEAALDQPLRWRKRRRIFVNSTSDLFHEAVPDEWIDKVFAVMALCPQHTFQILTKRPERMREYMAPLRRELSIMDAAHPYYAESFLRDRGKSRKLIYGHISVDRESIWRIAWPLPNVWLGVSVEDQVTADVRLPYLRATPSALRFISSEPLIGPVHLDLAAIDWVIVGGESGPRARPMHPDWVRKIRDQCAEAAVPFHFKQWGEWVPRRAALKADLVNANKSLIVRPDGGVTSGLMEYGPDAWLMDRIGKGRAGRQLDGVEHLAIPEGRA